MTGTGDRTKRMHVVVRGRVQGVGFRMYSREQARRLRLTGWVRNRKDGAVEIVAEGEAERLNALLRWAREGGPPAGRVDDVDAEYADRKSVV